MNLEELQIKISLELKDLEKQLKSVTKSIDKSIGPKTTKKLMQDNYRVIKAESIAINRELNKAFEVDYKKFNANLNSAMNQAKLTVRSACNDIRRELNNALNVKANIRITGKTSITGSTATGKTDPTAASNMASSQYIGAMIIKATNAILAKNNANTLQLKQEIKISTGKIISAIKGIKIDSGTSSTNYYNNNDDVVKAINKSTGDIVSAIRENSNLNRKTTPQTQHKEKEEPRKKVVYDPNPKHSTNSSRVDSGIFSTKPFDELIESVNELNFIVMKTIEEYQNAVEALKNATKVANIIKRGAKNQQQAIDTKMLGTGSYNNKVIKTSRPLEKAKETFTGEVIDIPDAEAQVSIFRQLQNIITDVNYEIKDTEIILANVQSRASSIVKTFNDLKLALKGVNSTNFTMGDSTSEYHTGKVVNQKKSGSTKALETEEPLEVSFKVIDEEIKAQVNEAISKIKQVKLPINDVFNFDTDEIIAKVRESNEAIKQAFKDVQNIRKQANIPLLGAPTEEKIKKPFTGSTDNVFAGSLETKSQKEVADSISEQVKIIKQAASGAFDSNGIIGLIADLFSDVGETIVKDLGNAIESPVYDHMQKIKEQMNKQLEIAEKNLGKETGKESLDVNTVEIDDAVVKSFAKQVQAIKDAWAKASDPEQLEKDLEGLLDGIKIAAGIANPINTFFEDLGAIIVRELANSIKSPEFENMQKIKQQMNNQLNGVSKPIKPKPLDTNITKEQEKFNEITKQIKGRMADLTNVSSNLNTPGSYVTAKGNKLIGRTGKLQSGLHMEDAESKLKKIQEQIKQISKEFDTAISEISSLDVRVLEEGLSSLKDWVPALQEAFNKLNQIDDERLKINLDTTEAQQNIETLKASLDMLIEACETNNLNAVRNLFGNDESISQSERKYPPKAPGQNKSKDTKEPKGKPPKPTIMGFGFGAYKNEIDMLIEYAKKAGSKIKQALFGKKDGGSSIPDELAMTIDDGFDDEINAILDNIYNCLKSISADVEAIKSMLTKNVVAQKESGDSTQSKSSTFDQFKKTSEEERLLEDDDYFNESVKEVLSKKVKDDAKFVLDKDPTKIYDIYEKFRDMHITDDSSATVDDLVELGNYIEELKNEIASKDLNKAFEIDVKDTIEGAVLNEESAKKINEIAEKYGTTREEIEKGLNEVKEHIVNQAKNMGIMSPEEPKSVQPEPTEFEKVQKAYSSIKDSIDEIIDKMKNMNKISNTVVGEMLSDFDINIALKQIDECVKKLEGMENNPVDLDVDLSEIEKTKKELLELTSVVSKLQKEFNDARFNIPDINLEEYRKRIQQGIKRPGNANDELAMTIDDDDSESNRTVLGFGFGAYKKELELLGELAKKAGAKIKKALSGAFDGIKGFGKNFFGNFDSHVAVHQVGVIKEKLNEIKDKYKETVSAVNKTASKIIAPFKKVASSLKSFANGISKGLNGAKKVLSGFANASKSLWGKIKSIFSKGANDTVKVTDKLKTGLGDLLKQALGFLSLYSLINLGKEAIQQSTMLAQSEVKLASLMKQRMGATNETVLAIRQLAEEQAKLGVVSETAMKHGAQQLSMYVHSAKALETLMPAIANLTAKRGGVFATEDDAEEIATQLGEAIREGTTTPLEQSGIYLSEAEIKKFQALRTEEERAAYLANVVAQNVGNINQALANTPHGAIAQLKNNFQSLLGTLGIFLANVIKPIVQWLNVIVVACNNALKALGKLLGFDMTGGALSVGDIGSGGDTTIDTGGIDDTTGAYEDAKDAADEATEANEKFKGSLMGFDELNILTDNTQKDSESDDPSKDPTNITPGEGGQLIPEVGELVEGESPFDKFADKMKAFIDEVLEPFKNAWALLGDRWKAAWADLIDSFKNFCDSLANFLKSVWENGGKEFVQHMAEIALAVGIAAMEIGGTILDALAKLWDHLDPEKNMHTQRLLDVLNEVSVKLRDFILGLNEHLENLLEYGGQDVLNAMGDCFMDLAAAAVNTFGVIIDAVDGLIDHLDPKFNVDTRNMLQATADMFHAVGQAAWDFSELLKSALANGGQDMINAFGTCVVNLGETAARVITTMMESFSAFFDYIDPAKNEITKNMMKAWEDAFYAIGDAALQFAELFESIMGNGGQEVLNKLGDAFNSLVGLVGTVVKEIADALNGLFEHLNPKTNEFTQGMLKAWQDAFDGISEMCQKIGEVLGSVMDNGGQDLLNSIGDLAMQVLETFGNMVDEVADCVGQLFEHLDPGKNKVAKGAIDAFKYFVDSIRNFVEMLGDALGTFMDNGGQEFINNIGDIVALLLDLGATIAGDIINAISAFFDSWAGHVVISTCATALELISEVLEGLLRILEPLSPIISGVVAAIGGFLVAQKVVGFIEGIVGAFKLLTGSGGILALAKAGFTALWTVISANPIAATVAAIVGIGTALVALYNTNDSFKEFIDNILKGFEGLVDKIKEYFSKILEDVRNIFGNVIDIITGIFEGDGYKVGEAVRNLITNVLKLIYDLNQSFVEIGWELIKGLVKGIWECIKNLPSLLAGFCEFVVDFFKGLFGIHSPSTVFAELGVNLIEGLIEGITSMFDAIGETISNLVDSILEAFNGITDKLSEIWNNVKDNATEIWTTVKDTIVDKCKETHDKVKEKYENIRDTVSDKLGEVKEKSSDAWTKIKDKTSDIVSKMKDDAEDKYSKLKDKLTTTMEDWRKNSEDKWNKIKEKTASLVDTLKKDAEDKYNKLKDKLTETMENWKKNSEEKWNNIKDKTADLVSNLKDDIEDKYNKFKDKLTDTMEDWRKNSEEKWTKIKEKSIELAENLKSTVEDKYDKFKEKLSTTLENLRKTSEDKWNDIKEKANAAVENLKTNAEDKFETLKTNLANKMSDIKSDMETKWNNAKDAISKAVETMRTNAENSFNTLKTNIGNKIEEVKTNVVNKWGEIKTETVNKVNEVVKDATTKYGEIKTNFGTKMDELKSSLEPKWENLKTAAKTGASKMLDGITSGLSNITKTITKPFEDAKTAVQKVIQSIGTTFKNANWSFPKLKLPHLKVSGSFSLNPPKVPSFSVEWYKRGGIIDGITPLGFTGSTLHMGGEAGKEMVVPLENTSFTTKIANAMGQAVDNAMARNMNSMYGSSYNTINDNRDIVLQINDREFARASINSINKLQRESGRTLLDI